MSAIPHMNDGTASLLREIRDRDSETGLLKAKRLYEVLLAETARSERYGNPLGCVRVCIRGLAPDQHTARLQLASRVAVVMRQTDYAGLWQTDEFLLVLPETDLRGAREFATKVKAQLDELGTGFNRSDGPAPEIATQSTAWQSGDDAESLLQRLGTRGRD